MNKGQSKTKQSEVRTTGSKVKSFLTKLLLVSLVLGLAYGLGTFKPNPYVVKKIQKELGYALDIDLEESLSRVYDWAKDNYK